jgi:transposase
MTFRPYDPDQQYLLPPSLGDWLPEGHLAYFVREVVEQLDLGAIYRSYDGSSGGQPPYHPTMMTGLLLYAYCVGLPSSRRIERATYEQVPFRVLSADQHPDHDTIAAFRQRHLGALAGLFVQALRLCQEAGLVKLGHVALDGTKVCANASKHKAMSYGRMEAAIEQLDDEVARLLELAEATDAAEDERFGKGQQDEPLPEALRHKQARLAKLREAKAALEQQARDRAAAQQPRYEEKKEAWDNRTERRGGRPSEAAR